MYGNILIHFTVNQLLLKMKFSHSWTGPKFVYMEVNVLITLFKQCNKGVIKPKGIKFA